MVAFCIGCSSNEPPLIPVSGKVTLEGKALQHGSVSFRPDLARGNTSPHQPSGALDSEGRYQLFTAGKSGAPAGWYKVVVFAYEEAAGGGSSHAGLPKSIISSRYQREDKTPFAKEVRKDAPAGDLDLLLEAK